MPKILPEATAPSTSPPLPSSSSPRRIGRLGIGFNVFVQLVLVVGLVVLANWLAFRHYKRFDYSRDRKFALSERTKQFLGGLDKPVRMTLFMAANAPLRSDVSDLMAEYKQVQPKFIQTETVNPYADVSRAAELATKYKLGPEDNVVIIDCEGRQKLVAQDAMADVDRSGEQFGQAPTVTAFKGEQALTGGLLEVVEAKKNVVYYLRGQNEPELGPRGPLTGIQQTLERDNVQLKELNLANAAGTGVPADASAVFLAGARYDLAEAEVKALEDYWNKQGRIFILLNPDAPTARLAGFLDRAGIRADDNRLTAIVRVTLPGGEPVLRRVNGVLGEAASDHPIVRSLKGVNFTVPGATQSLSLDAPRVRAANVRLTPLVKAQEGFWGEADFRGGEADDNPAASQFDAGRDKDRDLFYAVCAERGAVAEGRVSVPSARLVVVTNVRFIEDGQTTQEMADFFRNGLNWLLDRDRLIGIPPKEVKNFTLNVTDGQETLLFALTILVIPAAAALAGACVWFVRRS